MFLKAVVNIALSSPSLRNRIKHQRLSERLVVALNGFGYSMRAARKDTKASSDPECSTR